uniref:DDHD domain-containing protein n=1 Tax=Romanomermis culicivorax TaxID=13658 RepID=A0A915KXV4_ROMCU
TISYPNLPTGTRVEDDRSQKIAIVDASAAPTLVDGEKKTAVGSEDDRRSPPPTNVPFKKGAVKELNPIEVRWFHKLNKSADWLPFRGMSQRSMKAHLEKVGYSQWTDSNEGRDSLLIEVKRRLELKEPMSEDFPMKSEIIALCSNSIVVLDGYYELLLDQCKIKPIYWAGPSLDIMRGTWFTESDWLPLEEKLAEKVESQHVKMFKGQNIPESPVYSEKGQKPTTLMKIRRGYHTEATYEDGPLPVNHLLLVVHGIGQKRLVNQIISNATS